MAEVHDDESLGEIETVEQQITQTENQQQQQSQEPEVPEKYRGKTLADIVKMHQDTERNLSRQGQELGEVRRLADELLRAQLTGPKAKGEEKPAPDFFENPQAAIQEAIKSSPDVQVAQRFALQAYQEQVRNKLYQMHPDFDQVKSNPQFAEFVKASPIRMQLAQQADRFNLAAANELVSTFKQLHPTAKVPTVEKTARDQTLRAVRVDTGGSGEATKKTYRRADLIRLKMRDPAKYDELADSGELALAYQEGRVR